MRDSKVDSSSSVPGDFAATAAAFDVIALLIAGDKSSAADVLTQLDFKTLATVALQLGGLVAGTAIQAHEGDAAAAGARVSAWHTIAAHEHEMHQ